MKTNYEKMSQEEFDSTLDDIVSKMTPSSILAIDGVREIVQEELNNEVLEAWEQANPEKAQDWGEERTKINQLDRQQVVALLEGVSIACYDHETSEELRDALFENVKDGTIDPSLLDI